MSIDFQALAAHASDGKAERIQTAISRLIASDDLGETTRISLPVAYPSGSCAAVEININGDNCFITDCGLGFAEAEYASAQAYYDYAARSTARHYGVGYDGFNVFATWASLGKLEGAIVAVANASAQAVSAAMLRAATDKERRKNALLFDKVSEIFGHNHVTKTADIRGKEAEWQAHNVVAFAGKIAIFEFVAAHQNSIANKYQMFADLARIEAAPSLNAIVKSLDDVGAKGAMLADVSNIFEFTANDNEYRRFARLAA